MIKESEPILIKPLGAYLGAYLSKVNVVRRLNNSQKGVKRLAPSLLILGAFYLFIAEFFAT